MEAVLNKPILRLAPRLLVVLSLVASQAALAHGDEKPLHGGVMQSVREISYELASHEVGLMLYVADHRNPVSTVGITGTLALMQGAQRTLTTHTSRLARVKQPFVQLHGSYSP